MPKSIQSPRGTSDILPQDIPRWHALEQHARKLFNIYGYEEIRTPVYEETGLFKRSLGQSSEVVNKQLLELVSEKDDGLALRPEGTASIVRAYNQHGLDRKSNLFKFYYMGSMFRGERPQKGRLRQFHQIGAEAIGWGANNPLLDAEMIILAVRMIEAFGISKFTVKINSLGSPQDKAIFAHWLREELKDKVSSLGEKSQQQFEENVFRLLDSKDPDCRKIVDSLNIGEGHLSESGRDYFQMVREALDQAGIKYEVSAQLVRGLDYYTHTVFEIICPGLGSQDAIGAGGRYNGLIEQLGGGDKRFEGDVGAVGFALGMERILLAQNEQAHAASIDAFVVCGQAEAQMQAFDLVSQLREADVSADMDFGRRYFKKQMEEANKRGARFALILGEEEVKSETVSVKDMESGEQEAVSLKDIVKYLERSKE